MTSQYHGVSVINKFAFGAIGQVHGALTIPGQF
jgi:hypothetical protein